MRCVTTALSTLVILEASQLNRPNHLVIPSHPQSRSDEDPHRACPEQAQRAEGNLLFVPPKKQMRGPLPDRAPYSRILNFLFPYPSVNYFDAILPF